MYPIGSKTFVPDELWYKLLHLGTNSASIHSCMLTTADGLISSEKAAGNKSQRPYHHVTIMKENLATQEELHVKHCQATK